MPFTKVSKILQIWLVFAGFGAFLIDFGRKQADLSLF